MNEAQKNKGDASLDALGALDAIILFDDQCPMCRNLASLAARKAPRDLAFRSWQEFTGHTDERPDALGLWDGQQLLSGAPAWKALLAKHPALGGLNWAAARLNLTDQTATTLSTVSRLVRNLCTRCGHTPRKTRL